jgi:hypothetical protein
MLTFITNYIILKKTVSFYTLKGGWKNVRY